MKKKRVETFRKIYGMVTVTVKKKRVETFRKIYGMVTVVYIIIIGRAGASPPSLTTCARCLYNNNNN